MGETQETALFWGSYDGKREVETVVCGHGQQRYSIQISMLAIK